MSEFSIVNPSDGWVMIRVGCVASKCVLVPR